MTAEQKIKMSNVTPYCVFCKKITSRLKLFSEENLCKCSEILTIRKNNHLARHRTVLPTQINNFQLYHSQCYRRFTALPPKYRKPSTASVEASASSISLPQQEDDLGPSAEASEITQTGNASLAETDNLSEVNLNPQVTENIDFAAEADIVPENVTEGKNVCICFFCGKSRKKFKSREEKLSIFTKNGRDSIENFAIGSEDSEMIQKLQNLPSDENIFFHKKCKNNYITSRESQLKQGEENSEWHLTRYIRAEAYGIVEKFVAENIVCLKQSFFLKFLNDMFIEHLKDNQQDVSNFSLKPYHLKERLQGKFPKEISIISFKGQTLIKPFKGIMIKNEIEKLNILDAAACILHEEIRQIQCQKLPEQIETKNLINGECKAPETLINFYRKLISGENYRRRQSKKTTRIAKSFSEDLIFAISNDDDNEDMEVDSSDSESERDESDTSQIEND